MVSVPTWFCCLNPDERSILSVMIEAEVLTLFVGVPVAVYDALWVPVLLSSEARRAAFLSIYHLEIVTIVVDDEVEVEVVRPTFLPFWVEAAGWLLLPEASCPEGCRQVNYG